MLDITTPEINLKTRPRIVVVGVGGAGGNAVENMISQNLEGCEFLVANTDAQALKYSSCDKQIQLGAIITKGLGAGANPEIGRKAAEESVEDVMEFIDGANMVFVACGMGGGTGTGAAPIIAHHAREKGILTVGVVTKPFEFEGSRRMKQAEAGIIELQKFVDTLIIIPNQNLFYQTSETTSVADAFKMVDDVLHRGVRGVTDLMIKPGLINLDFSDIRTVMSEMGKAMMGTGEASGEDRALLAAENSINNKLLEDDNMKGALSALINITAAQDVSLSDVTVAVSRIRQELAEDANIIFGTTIDETMGDIFRVSIVATGIDVNAHTTPIDLNIENPQPDTLFCEKTETSDSFLKAIQGNDTFTPEAASIDTAPNFMDHEEQKSNASLLDIVKPEQKTTVNQENHMEIPSMQAPAHTSTPSSQGNDTLDPFLEAELSNASQNANGAEAIPENISKEKSAQGGFFNRLFGGISEATDRIERTEPIIETQSEETIAPAVENKYTRASTVISNEGNQSSNKKDDEDIDIPAFLKNQMN